MCLLVAKPADAEISIVHLRQGFDSNRDGCGFAYAKDGKIELVKGMFNWQKFYDEYEKVKQYPMLIHFRLSTAGKKNQTNCHPFSLLEGKYAMAHNGVINIILSDKRFSDTYHFAYQVIEPMLKLNVPVDDVVFQYRVEQTIGSLN